MIISRPGLGVEYIDEPDPRKVAAPAAAPAAPAVTVEEAIQLANQLANQLALPFADQQAGLSPQKPTTEIIPNMPPLPLVDKAAEAAQVPAGTAAPVVPPEIASAPPLVPVVPPQAPAAPAGEPVANTTPASDPLTQ